MIINKEYFGFHLQQRESASAVKMFAFYARVRDIKDWVGVRRVSEDGQGTQRILTNTRVNAVKRFIAANPENTIPGCILIAFSGGTAQITSLEHQLAGCLDYDNLSNDCKGKVAPGMLKFSFDQDLPEWERPAMVVDGQHRLYGLSSFPEENLPVLIVALIDADLLEQAFQFVVINNKSVRVPTDDVKSIIANVNEELLQERLLTAGVRYGEKSPLLRDLNDLQESPFYRLLDWGYNIAKGGEGVITLTAVEQSIRFIKILFDAPLSRGADEGDEDSLLQIFMAIWRGVKINYPSLWGRENKLMSKVAINSINEFIAERIKSGWEFGLIDIFDVDKLEKFSHERIKVVPEEFWNSEWKIPVQDNANVRKLIKSDLESLSENSKLKRVWHTDLKLPLVNSGVE